MPGPDHLFPLADRRPPLPGGRRTRPDGLVRAVRAVLHTGEIDLLNTTVGCGGPSYGQVIPNYRQDDGANLARFRRVRNALDTEVPIIATGKVLSPAMAEALLERGECELVAMTRAQFADPLLVTKAANGNGPDPPVCRGEPLRGQEAGRFARDVVLPQPGGAAGERARRPADGPAAPRPGGGRAGPAG